jgi:predicted alpha/beta-hydrolase family hydrolase
MEHPFMEALAAELANFGIATLRYQFPYLEEHRGAPDRPPVLAATVAAAVRAASDAASGLPVFAGGKSMGGRMSSQAAADGLLPNITGLVFFGFPLHPPKQPATKRADHLQSVTAPMLFLQGTRDDLADLQLLQPICGKLALRATLHIIEGADHSFHVLKKFRRTDADVMRELAETTAAWTERIIGQSAE